MKRSVSSANKRYLRVASRIAERLKTYQISGEYEENQKMENLKVHLPSKGNIFSIIAKLSKGNIFSILAKPSKGNIFSISPKS